MLIFVGGHPRSGTTMLKNICTSHPDFHVTGEYLNLCEMGSPYSTYARAQVRTSWSKGLRGVKIAGPMRRHRFGAMRSWGERGAFAARYLYEIRRALNRRANGDGHVATDDCVDAAVIEAALRRMFPKARIVGDKWPGYTGHVDRFAEASDLAGILIFRDARDVVSSAMRMARTKWWSLATGEKFSHADRAAKSWVKSIEALERHHGRFHAVRYEDLVCRPEPVLEALGQALDVDPGGFNSRLIRTTSIGRHHESLTREELAAVMEIAGPTMERLGYV